MFRLNSTKRSYGTEGFQALVSKSNNHAVFVSRIVTLYKPGKKAPDAKASGAEVNRYKGWYGYR